MEVAEKLASKVRSAATYSVIDAINEAFEISAKIADAWANSLHSNDPARRPLMKVAAEIRAMKVTA